MSVGRSPSPRPSPPRRGRIVGHQSAHRQVSRTFQSPQGNGFYTARRTSKSFRTGTEHRTPNIQHRTSNTKVPPHPDPLPHGGGEGVEMGGRVPGAPLSDSLRPGLSYVGPTGLL